MMYRFLRGDIAVLAAVVLVGGTLAMTRFARAMFASSYGSGEPSSPHSLLTVGPQPMIRNIPRIGVNLGGWTSYGAEQFRQNVIAKPGFEPLVEGRILEVSNPTAKTFEDDVNWVEKGQLPGIRAQPSALVQSFGGRKRHHIRLRSERQWLSDLRLHRWLSDPPSW